MAREKCYACDRKLGKNPHVAVTEDGQKQFVGSECYKLIGADGYQPPKGGPRLYRGIFAGNGELLEIVGAERAAHLGKEMSKHGEHKNYL